jgi:hypothetical protein
LGRAARLGEIIEHLICAAEPLVLRSFRKMLGYQAIEFDHEFVRRNPLWSRYFPSF